MKKFTKTIKAYHYEELSKTAKEVVKKWFLDDESRVLDLGEIMEEQIYYLFPNSDLKVQFSLNSCQGDGVNIYGTLNPIDLNGLKDRNLEMFKNFNAIEVSEEAAKKFHIKLYENTRYTYCVAYRMDVVLDDDFDENISEESFDTYRQYAVLIFERLCRMFESDGYDYLLTVSDEEVKENCEANGWMFFENGQFCQEADGMEEDTDDQEYFPGLYHVTYPSTSSHFLVKADGPDTAIDVAIRANKEIGEIEDESLEDVDDYEIEPVDFMTLTCMFRECSNKSSFWSSDSEAAYISFDPY